MRASREIADRMKAILARDKMGIHAGFMSALNGDVSRVFSDYFDLAEPPVVGVKPDDDGNYEITVAATAVRVKRFETTCDLPKPDI